MRRRIRNLAAAGLLALPLGVAIYTAMLYHDGRRVALPLGIELGPKPRLYASDDRWLAYLAPEAACPGAENRHAPPVRQERAMVCLINWARSRNALAPLRPRRELRDGAFIKARQIERCVEFDHDPCGVHPEAAARYAGYGGRGIGENLYFGTLELGAPRVAVDRWLNSPEHRRALFTSVWTDVGVAVLRAPEPVPEKDSAIWVAQFGRS